MNAVGQLIALSNLYCAATGIAEATLSTRLLGDGKRISAIRSGSDIGVRRLDRAVAWFSQNWPEGVAWPECVERPSVLQEPSADVELEGASL